MTPNPSDDDPPLQTPDLKAFFYGPGSLWCWYLALLCIVITWTVHPTKNFRRLSLSPDVVFVALYGEGQESTGETHGDGHALNLVATLFGFDFLLCWAVNEHTPFFRRRHLFSRASVRRDAGGEQHPLRADNSRDVAVVEG